MPRSDTIETQSILFNMEALSVPPLRYRSRTLDNGLTVLSLVDAKSPTVSIQVWYKVGSKDDPQGRSGFAHLFEHLMFKRTVNMRDEMLDRLTEDVGGENNAFTTSDVTVYHEDGSRPITWRDCSGLRPTAWRTSKWMSPTSSRSARW